MPSLTLFFPPDFADEAWASASHRLDAPEGDRQGQGEWLLGRHPAADLTLNLRKVSIRHCVISYSYMADRWSITDLGSTNGTRLNHQTLEPHNPAPLAIGDVLHIGEYMINVVEDDQDTVSSRAERTIASTEPLDYRPVQPPPPPPPAPAPAPAPPPAPPTRGLGDSLYLAVQWVTGAQTLLGQAGRVVMVATTVALVVVAVDLVQK